MLIHYVLLKNSLCKDGQIEYFASQSFPPIITETWLEEEEKSEVEKFSNY